MVVFSSRNISENELELTKENVLRKTSELNIFEYYFGEKINLKDSYKNPLRKDENAGCKFFIGRTGKLLFIDSSRSGSVRDCFGFICDKYDCNLYKALQIINRDFGLGFQGEKLGHLVYDFSEPKLEDLKKRKEVKKLLCLSRGWRLYDRNYWSQYGITLKTLKTFNVIPVQVVLKGDKIIWRNTEENPIYCYNFPNERKKKIYRPKEEVKSFKFLSSEGMSGIYQGFDQLPEKGELLIITKSLKDVMVLYMFGYNAIAPHSENYPIPLDFYDNLMDRFDNIILFYDNDNAGIAATEQIVEALDIPYIFIPEEYKQKDISDFYKEYGESETASLLTELTGF